jgi:hypothetical protein
MNLQQGGNAQVGLTDVAVSLNWNAVQVVDGDVSAYLLSESGKVCSDKSSDETQKQTGMR